MCACVCVFVCVCVCMSVCVSLYVNARKKASKRNCVFVIEREKKNVKRYTIEVLGGKVCLLSRATGINPVVATVITYPFISYSVSIFFVFCKLYV